jgi:hypothetical protein
MGRQIMENKAELIRLVWVNVALDSISGGGTFEGWRK